MKKVIVEEFLQKDGYTTSSFIVLRGSTVLYDATQGNPQGQKLTHKLKAGKSIRFNGKFEGLELSIKRKRVTLNFDGMKKGFSFVPKKFGGHELIFDS